MSIRKAQSILFMVFVIPFVLVLPTIVAPFAEGEINSDGAITLLKKLLVTYSVPLAIIIGGVFGRRGAASKSTAATLPFRAALVLSLLWTLLIDWRFVFFYFSSNDAVERVVAYVDTVEPASSFLFATALAFFFSKRD
jgi:hypothetical protein